jgi:hypothetical protein
MSALKVTVHAIFRGLLLSLFVFGARFAAGQEDAAPRQPALDAVPAAATDTLSDEQNQVADKYRRLEGLQAIQGPPDPVPAQRDRGTPVTEAV